MSGLVPMAEYQRLAARCERLEEELANLRQERREAITEARMGKVRRALRVKPQEAAILIELADRAPEIVPHWALARAVPHGNGDVDEIRMLRVLVSRVRAAARDYQWPVAIENLHGSGYRMSEAAAAWVREQMGEAQPVFKAA